MNDDGRWIFDQSGKPYPFEEVAAYWRPRKRDRFTPQMLQTYLAHFGLFPFDDDFYVVNSTSPALLLERPRYRNEPPDFSLEDVVAGKPWIKRRETLLERLNFFRRTRKVEG